MLRNVDAGRFLEPGTQVGNSRQSRLKGPCESLMQTEESASSFAAPTTLIPWPSTAGFCHIDHLLTNQGLASDRDASGVTQC